MLTFFGGVGAGPEKSEFEDKETFLSRDFSLVTSVILCCILNISLMVFKRVKQRKDCDYGQQLRQQRIEGSVNIQTPTFVIIGMFVIVTFLCLHNFYFAVKN